MNKINNMSEKKSITVALVSIVSFVTTLITIYLLVTPTGF